MHYTGNAAGPETKGILIHSKAGQVRPQGKWRPPFIFLKNIFISSKGPVLILEDDSDDQEISEVIFRQPETTNERKYFSGPAEFLAYLLQTKEQPKLIISDVNIAKSTGIELKKTIESTPFLKSKAIPYVFVTTYGNPEDIRTAYRLNSRGFFLKAGSLQEMNRLTRNILFYWRNALHPNNI